MDFTVTPADVLDRAADYITAYGWARGVYFDLDTLGIGGHYASACTLGAISFVVTGNRLHIFDEDETSSPIVQAAQQALRAHLVRLRADGAWADGEHRDGPGDCVCWYCATDTAISILAWNDTAEGLTADEAASTLHAAAEAWRAEHPGGGGS